MTLQFIMNADTAQLFFEILSQLPERYQDEDSRIKILKYLITQGYDISVGQTSRTPEQIAQDASKHGKVLYYKLGDENETK